MKWRSHRRFAFLLVAGFHILRGSGRNLRRTRSTRTDVVGEGRHLQVNKASDAIGRDATFREIAADVMNGRRVGEIIKAAHHHMSLGEATRRLEGKLPAEVSSLVMMTSGKQAASNRARHSEASMQQARKVMNDMMKTALQELDDVTFECNDFKDRNRETFDQLRADLARFGSEIASIGMSRISATEGTHTADRSVEDIKNEEEERKKIFGSTRFENQRELTKRKNDLAVFEFLLSMTACKKNHTELLQLHSGSNDASSRRPSYAVCNDEGSLDFRFRDSALQAKIERMMTRDARKALREALGQVQSHAQGFQLLDLGAARRVGGHSSTANSTTASPMLSVHADALDAAPIHQVDVIEDPSPEQWKKCVDAPYSCSLLHDSMSLQWGKFRDQYDELMDEMAKNQEEYDKIMANLNQQLVELNERKTADMEALADAVSKTNAIQDQMTEKSEQQDEVNHEYGRETKECEKRIEQLLFNDICAVRMIRDSILENSTISPPEKIRDCDVADWVADQCQDERGNELTCDDSCPDENPYKCGGMQVITRNIIVPANEYGVGCPALKRERRCNQRKCPVNCQLSEWSGWTKCSKECESGVQLQTRSVLVKPKNGGEQCDSAEAERPCNTQSCDSDCVLEDWTGWSPCTMQCSIEGYKGQQERVRKVLTPTRGQGKCPTEHHPDRYELQDCNTHLCAGDEICVAKQDLIIAIDASGSLQEAGFEALRSFASNLTTRYQGEYFGNVDMQVGIALFGQGNVEVLPDGSTTITPAEEAQKLTSDMAQVRKSIMGLQFQGGFTNMAQGLTLAESMLSQSRSDAQSAVMVLSDGKYSMEHQTNHKVRAMKDKNIRIYMVPIVEFSGQEEEVLKKWATFPWQSNYHRIPGISAIKYNSEIFAEQIIAKFCPESISPAVSHLREDTNEFMMIHESGQPFGACGRAYELGHVDNVAACASKARKENRAAFSFGKDSAYGHCMGVEGLTMDLERWKSWQADRASPPCPGGFWMRHPYFDTYAIKPTSILE
mmetsp:Transcript_130164/g.290952  ORF Transcript_130164/g.290952 Transcript_130164/m.290952 type:complete len:1014 (-) Transcript_130164:80-3121(-)